MQWMIKDWITNLTVLAILGALVDIILPNGHFRKYAGFIFGLVLIVMIMQPLLQLLGQFQGMEKMVLNRGLSMDVERIAHQSSHMEGLQQQQLETLFQKNLEASIAGQVKRTVGLEAVTVQIAFEQTKNGTDLSNIQRVDIQAEAEAQTVSIEPVEINLRGENRPRGQQQQLGTKEVREIKGAISALYEIHENRIFVNGE